jgi:hypothetical protein
MWCPLYNELITVDEINHKLLQRRKLYYWQEQLTGAINRSTVLTWAKAGLERQICHLHLEWGSYNHLRAF